MHTRLPYAFLLATLLHSATCTTGRVMKLHEATHLPQGFSLLGPASPDTILDMRIALKQRDPDGLVNKLMAVSEPTDNSYGQYLTKGETEEFITPSHETVTLVENWLTQNNISSKKISSAGDWMAFRIPAGKANTLFSTEFSVFKHLASGRESIRTLAYSIPADLSPHILLVHPTVSFPDVSETSKATSAVLAMRELTITTKMSSRATVPSSCATAITPVCVQDMYGLPTKTAVAQGNLLGISGFFNAFPSNTDLQAALARFRPDLAGKTFCVQSLDGGSQSTGSMSIEANVDIQYAVALVDGIPVCFISVGTKTRDNVNGMLDLINFLAGQNAPPPVVTLDFGQNENTVSRQLATSLCNACAGLGARGVSILVASGDGGVAGSQSGSCTTFVPTFPAGCPFVTSIGATSGVPETAAPFSAGGFSNFFASPSYQSTAVSSYLTHLGSTNSGKFNRTGRAFPDVAAIGGNIEVVFQNQLGAVSSTVVSVSIFAAAVTLVNDRLLAAGKPVLGFLNPFLYEPAAAGGAFNDITTGSNPGCNTQGFPAAVGWDPVTGLGTPSFAALAAAAGVP